MVISEYFKVSDTDESVLHPDENVKVELKTDNVQSFNTRWDETIAMKKQPNDEISDIIIGSFNSQSILCHGCLCTCKIQLKNFFSGLHQPEKDACPVLGTETS